ncbi:MAG: hypothetical protein JXB49_24100 [Bacteroidales bacterium]|nr:hypothetical protein [Bacteroidales bacterium]
MKKYSILIGLFFLVLISCEENDYLIDGGVHSPYVDKTTFDFLSSHPELDTFAYIIERAGLQDVVNSPDVTLFACTDYSVRIYLRMINNYRRAADPNAPEFTVDSIPQSSLDSLRMYIVEQKIERDDLRKEGTIYTTYFNDSIKVYLTPMDEVHYGYSYSDFMRELPEIIWFSRKRGSDFDEWDFNPVTIVDEDERERETDVKTKTRTSGIITTTGIVHVLDGMHPMLFRKGDSGSGI